MLFWSCRIEAIVLYLTYNTLNQTKAYKKQKTVPKYSRISSYKMKPCLLGDLQGNPFKKKFLLQ